MCSVISSLWYEDARRTRGAELDPFYYHLWKFHVYENSKWLRRPFQRHQNKKREGSVRNFTFSLPLDAEFSLRLHKASVFLHHFTSFTHNICVALFVLKYIRSGSWEAKNNFDVLHLPRVPEVFFFLQKLNLCFHMQKKSSIYWF